jgi:hypothetical protein
MLDHAKKCLLGYIFRVLFLPQNAPSQMIHPRLDCLDEFLKGGKVALSRLLEQLAVGIA